MTEITEINVSYKTNNMSRPKITSSEKAYEVIISSWNYNTIELQEEFKILLLNKANEVLGLYSMSKGGTSGTLVDLKLIFAVVLKCNAAGIILVHNHPSGNLTPSQADTDITSKIKKGAHIFDINLLDHLIVSKNGYYSFSDSGTL